MAKEVLSAREGGTTPLNAVKKSARTLLNIVSIINNTTHKERIGGWADIADRLVSSGEMTAEDAKVLKSYVGRKKR